MQEIKTILRGGLGNQLFQIAASIYFARRFKSQVLLDDSEIYRHPDSSRRAWSRQIDLKTLFGFKDIAWIGKRSRLLTRLTWSDGTIEVTRESDLFDIGKLERDLIVRDWFIHKRFVQETLAQNELRKLRNSRTLQMFSVPKNRILSAAAIHIRQGDFKNTSWGVLSDFWYQTAVEKLLNMGITEIDCYSDEITEAKRILTPYFDKAEIRFPEESHILSPILLLSLLSNYEHFVSSNSTLSWWGAYLNTEARNILCCWQEELLIDDWQTIKIQKRN